MSKKGKGRKGESDCIKKVWAPKLRPSFFLLLLGIFSTSRLSLSLSPTFSSTLVVTSLFLGPSVNYTHSFCLIFTVFLIYYYTSLIEKRFDTYLLQLSLRYTDAGRINTNLPLDIPKYFEEIQSNLLQK